MHEAPGRKVAETRNSADRAASNVNRRRALSLWQYHTSSANDKVR